MATSVLPAAIPSLPRRLFAIAKHFGRLMSRRPVALSESLGRAQFIADGNLVVVGAFTFAVPTDPSTPAHSQTNHLTTQGRA